MASRGLASKKDTLITLKGLINFYSNITAFINARVVNVGSSLTNSQLLFYNSGSVTYGNISLNENNL